jgi:hypothetical protein
MREETPFLEDIADAAAMRAQEDAALRIAPGLSAEDYTAIGRADEAGDDIDQCRLAGTRGAKERGQAATDRCWRRG